MTSDDSGNGETGFVSHLECSATGARVAAGQLRGLSAAGAPLLVRYDLPAIKAATDRQALAARAFDMWRFRELLPLASADDIVSLGESVTPLVVLRRAAAGGGGEILVKDEGRMPTGSF